MIKVSILKEHIQIILADSPIEHDYHDHVWSVPLIAYDAGTKLNLMVRHVTVTPALHSYSYKRPSKTVPARVPTRKEKARRIESMLEEIKTVLSLNETEIYAFDESHFSTEPYLIRGWYKKRWPPQNRNKRQARKSHVLWMLEVVFTAA